MSMIRGNRESFCVVGDYVWGFIACFFFVFLCVNDIKWSG